MWIERTLGQAILEAAKTRPALLLTGVRQAGKSSLLQNLFPDAVYVTLDRIILAQSAEENPQAFIQQFKDDDQVIIDEVQYAPGLFRELKIDIDENRNRYGKWILTGSQKFPLMQNSGESLAGRIAIFHLETLSAVELSAANKIDSINNLIWMGGYPELWANSDISPSHFYEDYIQTYLERDLRDILHVSSLRDFQKFIRACAIRTGQLVNYTDMAKDVGVSPNTIKSWINIIESSGIIILLQPFFANIGKRFIKAPKLYFTDQGLLCGLLNVHSDKQVFKYIRAGALWENFVFTELIKNSSIKPSANLFFYRDQNNVEIDFLIENNSKVMLIEAKMRETVNPNKLNFSKVTGLFPDTECIVACRILETKKIYMKNYTLINPLYCSVV